MNTSSGQYDANCTMHKIAAESGGKQFEGAFRPLEVLFTFDWLL